MDETLKKQVQDRREKLREEEASAHDAQINIDVNEEVKNPIFCRALNYIFFILIISYFVAAPILMFYIGVQYLYCNDLFAPWLIVGGVLHVCTYLLLLLNFIDKQECNFFQDKNGILFFTFLFITFIWYVFGFGRIFSGSMNDDPLMEDEVCRWYLYKLPFWITLMPIFLMIPMCFIICYYIDKE